MATELERYLNLEIIKIKRKLCCINTDISGLYTFDGIVNTFGELPDPTLHPNEIYYVKNTTEGSIGGIYYSNGTSWISSLTLFDTRITNLENNVYKVTYYALVTGASGTITPPTGATFNSGEFGDSGNSILSKINGSNKPTFQSPLTVGGVVVTANLNTTTGGWTTSGTYVDASVALIYSVNISAEDFSNLNNFYIIESEENVTGTLLTGYASTTGAISASDTILTAIEKLNGNIAAIPPSTLLGVSAASLTTPNSIYNLSAGIPLNFKSSDGNSILYLDETNERVGIGTATPATQLHITGTATLPTILGGSSTTQDLTFQTTSGVGTTGADMHFLVGNNGGTEAMTILNSGLVGIGTAAPSNTLTTSDAGGSAGGVHIKSSTTTYAALSFTVSGGVAQSQVGQSGNSGALANTMFFYNPNSSGFVFSERVNIGSLVAGKGMLTIPVAPTASSAYGLASFGNGAWDGLSAGFFSGAAAGTLLAGNLASGSTSDLMNLQVGGVSKLTLLNAGSLILNSIGGQGFNLNVNGTQVGGSYANSTDYNIYVKGTRPLIFNTTDSYTEMLRLTSTGLLTFQGITSSFPALKRSTTGLISRLADDSADTWFQAAYYVGSTQALTGAGAANVTTETTKITSSGVLDAISLADGVDGQTKTILHDVDGGSFVLTPTTKTGWTTFTSTVVGESITLRFVTTRGWIVIGSYLGVIA